MKKAFITGITGQDGSYLAEFLLAKGYEIHGLIRRASTFNTDRIDHLYKDFHDPQARVYLHYGDLSVSGQLTDLLQEIRPDEIYHLGAQSHVRVSFDMPEYTGDVTGLGTIRIIEAIRKTGIKARFYQASSSEMFGAAPPPQSETTPFHPQSPYAAARFTPIMSSATTEKPINSLLRTASSSTMNLPAAVRLSLPGRSPAPPPVSS
jgi:GDPmannose 4,6-dehydratase